MAISKGVMTVLAALEAASSRADYERAKVRASRLDTVAQFAIVDSVKACRARLLSLGVL